MTIFQQTLSNIIKFREGRVKSIPLGFPKLDSQVFMAQKQYHLIGGASGSGKSSLVDNIYILNPYMWYRKTGVHEGTDLKIILRSMERSKELRYSKWICAKLYWDHRIIIDVKTLNGFGFNRRNYPDDVFEKIIETKEFFEELEDIVEVIDGAENPTGIFSHLKDHALKEGKYYYFDEVGKRLCIDHGKVRAFEAPECPRCTKHEPIYVADNPDKVVVFIVDHILSMKKERGFSDKQNLDKMSEYARIARDRFGYSPVMVSQLNRNITDTFRRVKTDLLPEDSDFAGSSNMYNDCDMAAILFNPYKYGLDRVYGYPTSKFVDEKGRNRFRTLHILKSSYGIDNLVLGYGFLGENGLFSELPKATEMIEEHFINTRTPKHHAYYG